MEHQQLKEELKKALKEKDGVKLSVIRGILSALTNEAVTKGKKPDELLNPEEVLIVIKRQAKQRQDSIEQFTNGGRPELAQAEEAELKIIETYLPTPATEDEIRKVAEQKKNELNINDKTKIGILIGATMKDLGSNADGNTVKKIVEDMLS